MQPMLFAKRRMSRVFQRHGWGGKVKPAPGVDMMMVLTDCEQY